MRIETICEVKKIHKSDFDMVKIEPRHISVKMTKKYPQRKCICVYGVQTWKNIITALY